MQIRALFLAAPLMVGTPVMAQDAAAPVAPKAGQMIRTSDGGNVGHIEEVATSGGQATSVSVIYQQRFIHIPASTLAAGPKGLVTSLTRKDIAKLD